MDLGFDTAGNATLIVYDRGPLLVTDPWIDGPAYFGSWTQSHEIGEEQRAAIRSAPFVWISHGHPDHLSNQSVGPLRSATILLPDHVGSRIADAFREDGYRVQVLPDRQWTRLSDRVRVDYVEVLVGGETTRVELAARRFDRGVTFELPRQSLMTAIGYEVFEDLFIGNFMKTTYHGEGEFRFGAFINRLKWADNGRARSAEDLAAYLAEYRRRAGVWERLRFGVEQRLLDHAHRLGAEKTALYRFGRELYRRATR